MVEGKLQWDGEVLHVIVSAYYNISKLLRRSTASQHENVATLSHGFPDEETKPGKVASSTNEEKVFLKGRLFH